jgi:hypothetical protein
MKITSIIKLALPLLLTSLFGSCVIYHPHNVDIPLLREKGEVDVDANFSPSAPLLGAPAFNGTVSFAPLNHVGIQAAVCMSNANSFYMQAAGGGFLPMGDNAVLEGYAGYGFGTSVHKSDISGENSYNKVHGHYNLVFGQVNTGWVNLLGGIFDIGFGFKGGLMMPNFEKDLVHANGEVVKEKELTDSHVLLQPQFMVRMGWQQVKLSLNIGYAYLSNWHDTYGYFNFEPISVGLGVHFDL